MAFSAREFPYQPAVDSAEKKVALLGALAHTLYVIKYPAQLGGAEIGVDKKTRL